MALALLVELRGVLLQQDLAESVDRAQRRAQVVGHGIGERFQFAVGHFQFVRALGHATLEILVQAAQFFLLALALGEFGHEHEHCHHGTVLVEQVGGVELDRDVVPVAVAQRDFVSTRPPVGNKTRVCLEDPSVFLVGEFRGFLSSISSGR